MHQDDKYDVYSKIICIGLPYPCVFKNKDIITLLKSTIYPLSPVISLTDDLRGIHGVFSTHTYKRNKKKRSQIHKHRFSFKHKIAKHTL